MATIETCDKCKRKKKDSDRGWHYLSLRTSGLVKIEELDSIGGSWDFCPECSKSIVKDVLRIVKKNK